MSSIRVSLEAEPGSLQDSLMGAYRELLGGDYDWRTGDDNAMRLVLTAAKNDYLEALKRWRNGLTRTRFPVCASIADLAKHWNAYAKPEPATTHGRASEADRDWTQPVRTDPSGKVVL
jgi:hypothetical protein